MKGRTETAECVLTRLGATYPYLFVTSARAPLADQGIALFETVSRILCSAGGWFVDRVVRGASAHGFVEVMQDRAAGRLAWDAISQHTTSGVREAKKPHTMLVRAGYPCWAAQGHVFSLDLFNPSNELMFPYVDEATRLWALLPYPPQLLMTDGLWPALLREVAVALNTDCAFGGGWVWLAAKAYVYPDNLRQLDERTRLADMAYAHMILPREALTEDGIERLRSGVAHGSRSWRPAVCEEFAKGRYVFISTTPEYTDENVHLGRHLSKVVGRPYVASKLAPGGGASKRATL